MSSVTIREIRELLGVSSDPCVSLYMPTYRRPPESRQNPVRLRNLTQQAATRLRERGFADDAVDATLRPLRDFVSSSDAWRGTRDGLALFIADGELRRLSVACSLPERVVIGGRFHVLPLLPLLRTSGRYFVLAISEKRARLFAADREDIREMVVPEMPQGLVEAIHGDALEHEHATRFRVRESVRLGKRAATSFATASGGGRTQKKELVEYFRVVERCVRTALRGETAPLMLLGVEYYLPIYSEVSSYPHLLDTVVPGQPDRWTDDQIHAASWNVIEDRFLSLSEPRSLYERLEAAGSTATSLDDVLTAAHEGRVRLLFVAEDSPEWGTWDASAGRSERSLVPGGEELLDLAASQTLLRGGSVYAVRRELVPAGGVVAAGLRDV